MSEIVLVEKEGPLALITLNRPEKLNALDYALRRSQSPATTPNSAKPRSISDLRRLSAARSGFRG